MEVKKDAKVDLERKRLTAFLLGLVATLTILYVALEIRTPAPGEIEIDSSLLDDLMAEMELAPIKSEERIPLITIEQPKEAARIIYAEEAATEVDELVEAINDSLAKAIIEEEARDSLATGTTTPQNTFEMDGETFRIVRELPSFPGGATEMMKWLTANLKYPETARRNKIEGEVVAQFIVEKDGAITNIRLITHPSKLLEREAMRVLKKMPTWTPGIEDGQPCRTVVQIPIVFKL